MIRLVHRGQVVRWHAARRRVTRWDRAEAVCRRLGQSIIFNPVALGVVVKMAGLMPLVLAAVAGVGR